LPATLSDFWIGGLQVRFPPQKVRRYSSNGAFINRSTVDTVVRNAASRNHRHQKSPQRKKWKITKNGKIAKNGISGKWKKINPENKFVGIIRAYTYGY